MYWPMRILQRWVGYVVIWLQAKNYQWQVECLIKDKGEHYTVCDSGFSHLKQFTFSKTACTCHGRVLLLSVADSVSILVY